MTKKFFIFSAITGIAGLAISLGSAIHSAIMAPKLARIQGEATGKTIVDESVKLQKEQNQRAVEKAIEDAHEDAN